MAWRIRDRSTFETLRRDGRRSRRGPITVTYAPAGDAPVPRVAYAVGKKVGGSVARNRLRRRLRAAVADMGSELGPGAYLVSAGPEAAGIAYEELRATVAAAMTAARTGGRR